MFALTGTKLLLKRLVPVRLAEIPFMSTSAAARKEPIVDGVSVLAHGPILSACTSGVLAEAVKNNLLPRNEA